MEQFRLLAKGHFLVDDAIVRECHVVKGSKLLLMARNGDDPPATVAVQDESTRPACDEKAEEDATASLDVIREWEDTENGPVERPEQIDKTHCWTCAKHVGLTGVECRCGYIFCAHHRYAECHDCDFDHQGYHRSILERQLLGHTRNGHGGSIEKRLAKLSK